MVASATVPPPPSRPEPPKWIAEHIKRGSRELSLGKPAEALQEYELARRAEASLKNPKVEAHILWCIGAALHMLERYEEALAYFDKASQLVRDDWQLHFARGVVLNSLGFHKEA